MPNTASATILSNNCLHNSSTKRYTHGSHLGSSLGLMMEKKHTLEKSHIGSISCQTLPPPPYYPTTASITYHTIPYHTMVVFHRRASASISCHIRHHIIQLSLYLHTIPYHTMVVFHHRASASISCHVTASATILSSNCLHNVPFHTIYIQYVF